jgi:hypothetical protein
MDGIDALRPQRPLTIISCVPGPGWRQLSYYAPDAHVLAVMERKGSTIHRLDLRGRRGESRASDGFVPLPSCGIVAWVDPVQRPQPVRGTPVEPLNARVVVTRVKPGDEFDFYGYRFIAGSELCASARR